MRQWRAMPPLREPKWARSGRHDELGKKRSMTRRASYDGIVVTTPVTNGNAPDLVISKTHVGAFVVGQQGQYQLTVKNQGTSPETGAITVIDTLNPSLSFVSGNSPGGFSCSGGPTVTCTRPAGSLTNGASDIITLTVNVASNASVAKPSISLSPSMTNSAIADVRPMSSRESAHPPSPASM